MRRFSRSAISHQGAALRRQDRKLEPGRVGRAVTAARARRRHARHRTAHTALIADILSLLAGTSRPAAPPAAPQSLREPLSKAETRVLRYLPTNLTVSEIADQLYLLQNTIRTHMRHIYDKLDAHRRHEAVARARTVGLLVPFHTMAASADPRMA